jgi:hypothetical protein
MSVPGVGQTTAMTWLAEVCDPRRFTDAKEVSAYSGCDPSLKVSAGKVTSHTRRRGNLRLHWALVQAATGLLRRPGTPLAQWGLSLQGRHKKGGYRKATGALARRLAVMLWHVHRLGVKFDPSKYCFEAVPPVPCVPIAAMGLAPRVTALLAGYGDSRAAAAAYYKGHLASLPGFGPAAMQALGKWIHEHTTHHRPTPRANETKPEPSSSAAAGGPTSTGAVPGRPVAVRQNNHATSEGRAA